MQCYLKGQMRSCCHQVMLTRYCGCFCALCSFCSPGMHRLVPTTVARSLTLISPFHHRALLVPHLEGYDRHLAVTGAAVLGVIGFYMVTEEPLTTIAHVCAVILGCGIALVLPAATSVLGCLRRVRIRQRPDESPSAAQDPLLPPGSDPRPASIIQQRMTFIEFTEDPLFSAVQQ